MSRKLMIVCVDGGKAHQIIKYISYAGGSLKLFQVGPGKLKSVFPSSTAPAHASFLTGVIPGVHGILGNRYFEGESVSDIRAMCDDPLRSIHPYERHSLMRPSLIDRFQRAGGYVAGVHFPHTFDRADSPDSVLSSNCLYAPSRQLSSAWVAEAGSLVATIDTQYFSRQLRFELAYLEGSDRCTLTSGQEVRQIPRCSFESICFTSGTHELWVPMKLVTSSNEQPILQLGTATLVVRQFPGSGVGSSAKAWVANAGSNSHVACSGTPSYELAKGASFHEAPSIEWTLAEALERLESRPHLLLIRFNQVDHAQEALYWYAKRAGGEQAEQARSEIRQTYIEILSAIVQLIELAEDYDVVLFSDHGIDWVERQLAPNAALDELGLSESLIFQGDSNIAYLYGQHVSRDAVSKIMRLLRSHDRSVRWRSLDSLASGGCLSAATLRRAGLGAVTCGPHRKFDYDDAEMCTVVRSASHGYSPSAAPMDGFFAARVASTCSGKGPASIADVAGWIELLG